MELNLDYTGQLVAASYTPEEKQAIYQALCGAVKTDGKVDPREIQMLNHVKSAMHITEADIVASRTHKPNENFYGVATYDGY